MRELRPLIAAAVLITLLPGSEQILAQEAPCEGDAAYRSLDFRLGSWELTGSNGVVFGLQTFTKSLDGCAIIETYESTSGRIGHSLTYYDPAADEWRLSFADNLGNWSEARGHAADGVATFEGRTSRFPFLRWTVSKVSDDELRGVNEVSEDGTSWTLLGEQTLRRAGREERS